ncbi:MAG: hypothetical protein IT342_19890 [Candidatus Melainabacteria bacterium]|nr:hypothetical protein [Candidatus Melainabacteria bacterium]
MATKLPAKKTNDELEIDCEVAAAILAECFAYFAKQLAEEKKSKTPNEDKLKTLEAKLLELKRDEMALGPENVIVINNALYVLAPLLRKAEV